jgi:hypothetical protein
MGATSSCRDCHNRDKDYPNWESRPNIDPRGRLACSATRPGSFQQGEASVTIEEEKLIKRDVDFTATHRT